MLDPSLEEESADAGLMKVIVCAGQPAAMDVLTMSPWACSDYVLMVLKAGELVLFDPRLKWS